MNVPEPSAAQRIAQAAMAFEKKRTGHSPHSVSVVLSGDTLVITLHEALTEAEKKLASTANGSAEIQEFHKKLFDTSSAEFRQIIKDIIGFDVREARTEVCSSTGTVVQVFSSGTVVPTLV